MGQGPTGTNSVDHLVADARRFVSKRRFRVELDELLAREVQTLAEALGEDQMEFRRSWTREEFARRVALYEGLSERLARTLGIVGRWGDGSELSDVLHVLFFLRRSLGEGKSGTVFWLDLHLYPVVLLVAAYGLALTRSERWASLHGLLSAGIKRDSQQPSRVVEDLSVSAWRANEDDAWHTLDGLDRRKTPLSDHVCEVLYDWSDSYIGVVASFEELYDLWDVLGSLSFIDGLWSTSPEEGETGSGAPRWVPMGRVRWRTQSRFHVLYRVRHDLSASLLEAGFFGGERGRLNQAVDHLSANADRMMW